MYYGDVQGREEKEGAKIWLRDATSPGTVHAYLFPDSPGL